jgi:SPP1 gp7 family putative phage head morphogenesis protein
MVAIMQLPTISFPFMKMVEKELANLLGFDIKQLESAEEQKKKELELPQPLVPGQNRENKGIEKKLQEYIKQNSKGEFCVYSHQTGKNFGCYPTREEAEKRLAQIKRFSNQNIDIEIKEDEEDNISIEEWLNFNYREYLQFIIGTVDADKFEDLLATSSQELEAGYLSSIQVEKLKRVLNKGFTRGDTLRELGEQIRTQVKPGTLYKIDESGNVMIKDGERVIAVNENVRNQAITRSEVTRLANQGTLEYYKSKGISMVQYVSSVGTRTCEICNGYNGRIMSMDEANRLIPVHTNCRCMWIAEE